MVSMDLESGLQKAYNMAADYLGLEPPEVKISRDFDLQRLIGQDIAAMAQLFEDKVIDREEFRDMLVQGEILPTAAERSEPEQAQTQAEPNSDQIERLINVMMQ